MKLKLAVWILIRLMDGWRAAIASLDEPQAGIASAWNDAVAAIPTSAADWACAVGDIPSSPSSDVPPYSSEHALAVLPESVDEGPIEAPYAAASEDVLLCAPLESMFHTHGTVAVASRRTNAIDDPTEKVVAALVAQLPGCVAIVRSA